MLIRLAPLALCLLSVNAFCQETFTEKYNLEFAGVGALVGFIGEAALYDNGAMNSDSFYTSGGGGVRYRLSDDRPVNFRIDYAVGEGNSDGFYVGMNEAF